MLALTGGNPIRTKVPEKFPWFSGFDSQKLLELIADSKLSGFLATPSEEHLGGNYVRQLENNWNNEFLQAYSVAFNSWTSGLEAAVASCNLPKGSQVITTSWTMSATVGSIVSNGLVPYFVDISPEDFNMDVDKILDAVNRNTSAILAIDIFGKPCNADLIKDICDSKSLSFIVDAAQTPKAKIKNKRSVEYSHVGGYSLNRHKHLQVGEGGVAVTNDSLIAKRMRLYRNHAEVTSETQDEAIPVGHNLRMGEIEALLAIHQLEKFDHLIEERRGYGRFLLKNLGQFEWIQFNVEESFAEHDFYILPMQLNVEGKALDRDKIVMALKAEGLSEAVGKYGNLHKLTAFRDFPRQALNNSESLAEESFLGIYLCGYRYTLDQLNEILDMFKKIDDNLEKFMQK